MSVVDQPRLWIFIPCYEKTVSTETMQSVMNFVRDTSLSVQIHYWNRDIVRARSRAVREFLVARDRRGLHFTHLLFLDNDVSFAPQILPALLKSGKDLIGAVYPRKQINWNGILTGETVEQRAMAAYDWPMLRIDTEVPEEGILKVACLPMGCTMMSRTMLEKMVEHYSEEKHNLVFNDINGEETVALFQIVLKQKKLFPEDFSFCLRAQALDFYAHVLLQPTTHTGSIELPGDLLSQLQNSP